MNIRHFLVALYVVSLHFLVALFVATLHFLVALLCKNGRNPCEIQKKVLPLQRETYLQGYDTIRY